MRNKRWTAGFRTTDQGRLLCVCVCVCVCVCDDVSSTIKLSVENLHAGITYYLLFLQEGEIRHVNVHIL